MNYSRLTLIGKFVRDPEYRSFGCDNELVTFTLVVSYQYGQSHENTYFDCKMWGDRALAIKEHYARGDFIFVEGRMRMDSWMDKQTKKRRTRLYLDIDNYEFMGPAHRETNKTTLHHDAKSSAKDSAPND